MTTSRNIDPNERINELSRDLKSLDDQFARYRDTRQGYVQAIEALKRIAGSSAGNGSTSRPEAPQTPSTKKVSKTEAVDEAINAMSDQFTATSLKTFIVEHFPAVGHALKPSYISTRLAYIAEHPDASFKLHEKGGDGKPNIWVKKVAT